MPSFVLLNQNTTESLSETRLKNLYGSLQHFAFLQSVTESSIGEELDTGSENVLRFHS